ncbi:MAG TPA: V-type ATPase subunit [Thermoclostridium sp.]|nr:V-type ATPase subunit [Thermoclostridium sp.]HPU44838.1 V-type ATPase subunit [Thermoclostridium sp.]
MLFSAIKYGAVSGKTRAMAGKLFKPRDYEEIMQKRSVREVAAYLKYNTGYSAVLADINEAEIHRGQLENILKLQYINDYKKLMRFSSGSQREFINLLYLKMVIENLKLLLRLFEAGNADPSILEESLPFLSRYDDLDIQKLALSRSLEEFIAGLRGTDYAEVMRPYASMDKGTRLFHLEMALDLYYLRKVLDMSTGLLNGDDKRTAMELNGIEIDIFNIFWIYRIRKSFSFDKELVYTYIIPSWYRIKRAEIDGLISAKNTDEFRQVLGKTPYAGFFADDEPGAFERRYTEYLYEIHRKRFIQQPFSVACIISYLKLKEFELNNIISIIEGIRYSLPPEEIRKFITGVRFDS